MKKWLRIIAKWAAAMGLSIAAFTLGLKFGTGIPHSEVWHWLSFSMLLVCVVLSLVLSLIWGKSLKS